MSLLRLSLWMVLILALIPTSQGNRYSLYTIISGTAQDIGGFCKRRPETCLHSRNAFFSLQDKAAYMGKVFSNAVSNSSLDTAALKQGQSFDENGEAWREGEGDIDSEKQFSVGENEAETLPSKAASYSQNTLKQEDLAADWLPPA